MARLAGVDLPRNKRLDIGLTYLYGIGRTSAGKICTELKIDPATKTDSLTEDEIIRLRTCLEQFQVEGDLRRATQMNIKRLMDLGCYRGMRHRRHLPVHGQRTKTNARTRKGPKRPIRR